jgi:hypothetical protein
MRRDRCGFGTRAKRVEDPQFYAGVQNLAAPSAKDKIQYLFLRRHASPGAFKSVKGTNIFSRSLIYSVNRAAPFPSQD